MHYLYSIFNLINNKVYIGQTVNPSRRWSDHKWLSINKQEQYIHRAMNKYGIENFIFEVIATCLTSSDADEIETQLIIQYDSRNKEKGYNLKSGGKTWDDAFRQKMSETMKQYFSKHPISEEQKQKMRDWHASMSPEEKKVFVKPMVEASQLANKGKDTWMKGKTHTEEAKQKQSVSHLGKKTSTETKVKLSLARSGEKNPMYGTKMPEAHKQKLIAIHLGKCKLSEQQLDQMKTLRATGMSHEKIAKEIGCNWKSVAKWLKTNGK